jgi:outer membrane protein assembly factor BamB
MNAMQASAELTPQWSYDADSSILGSAAIDHQDNTIFGALNGNLYSLNSNGLENWVFSGSSDWIESTPTIAANGTIYFGSWDNYLYAVNGSNGQMVWRYETGNFVSGSAALDNEGNIYFGSSDGIFYSLQPNGSLRWAYIAEGEIESSPAISKDGVVYFGDGSGTLHAVDKDTGLELWTFDASVISPNQERKQGIYSSPAIAANGVVIFGSANHRLYALDSEGLLRWTFDAADRIDSSPIVGIGNRIYVASRDGYLYALEANGALIWEKLVGDVFYCSPASDQTGTIFIVSYVGEGISAFFAIAPNGQTLRDFYWIGFNDSSPALTHNGDLFIGFHDGLLFKFANDQGPAATAWPQFQKNTAKNGRIPTDFKQTVEGYFHMASIADLLDWSTEPFGLVQAVNFPWVFIQDFGWLYAYGSGNPHIWLYSPTEQTYFYSSSQIGSWIWSFKDNSWSYIR